MEGWGREEMYSHCPVFTSLISFYVTCYHHKEYAQGKINKFMHVFLLLPILKMLCISLKC